MSKFSKRIRVTPTTAARYHMAAHPSMPAQLFAVGHNLARAFHWQIPRRVDWLLLALRTKKKSKCFLIKRETINMPFYNYSICSSSLSHLANNAIISDEITTRKTKFYIYLLLFICHDEAKDSTFFKWCLYGIWIENWWHIDVCLSHKGTRLLHATIIPGISCKSVLKW